MIQQKMIKTGVIGHPINHSKSPLIHSYWIEKYAIRGHYEAIDVSCETLAPRIQELIKDGYIGFNVTLPHKIAIMKLCDEIDDLARSAGAVNTVTIRKSKLYGTNTDIFGFTQNIFENSSNFSFAAGPSLLLGAGGAARAVVQGLLMNGAPEIRIANRTLSTADELVKLSSNSKKIKLIPWEERSDKKHVQDVNILINTTSLGMTGKSNLEINLEYLPKSALVHDIVYSPLMTDLLCQAESRGNPVVTGIGMLLHQARPAFHAWFNVMPEMSPDLLQRVML